ncbi:MAG: chemotaxis protein CheW [Oceanospirillaceae bacterium]|nr:chemotaxis protein CheW [Oceanospirillaceae bacterium]
MSIDTSEFLDVLMEDSLEALSDMETSLLDLDNGGDDSELINTIFRGAHSIKGGSGMLGLDEVAGFTHLMETLLDEVREGQRKIDMPVIGLLLECVDALRGMFAAIKEGVDNDAVLIASLVERLTATLENREPVLAAQQPEPVIVTEPEIPKPEVQIETALDEPFPDVPSEVAEIPSDDPLLDLLDLGAPSPAPEEDSSMEALLAPPGDFVTPGWAVQFVPDHDLFLNGFDPLDFIRQLAKLGGVDAKSDINVLPGLARINPEQCYMAWDINVVTDVSSDAVREVFSPVASQCELIIEPLQEAHANQLRAIIAEQEAARKEQSGQDAVSYLRETVLGESSGGALEPEMTAEDFGVSVEPGMPAAENENDLLSEKISPPAEDAVSDRKDSVAFDTGEQVSDTIDPASDSDSLPVDQILPEIEIEAPIVDAPADSVAAPVSETPAVAEAPAAKPEIKPAAKPKSKAGARAADRKANDNGGSIRVSTQKIDALINMAGELVITQAMLAQLGEKLEDSGLQEIEHLRDGLAQLERNSRELQDAVMSIRMLPISFAFSRFPRMIRDLATKFDKKVRLVTTGEQTELDKTVMEKIGDPLVHLVRNSFDHGIEMPQDRITAGKDETGTIELNAYHQGGNIVIEVIDDGKGLDRDVIIAKAREKGLIGADEQVPEDKALELIFEPGFSTAAQVSDLSGRGVGMDVVRRNIRDLGGHIELESEQGKGTRFTIRLPLTLAILDGQLVTVGNETFIVPLISIVESLQIQPEHMKTVAGQTELYHLRDEYIPVVKLNELFSIKRLNHTGAEHDLLVVVEGDGKKIGLQVDDLLGQQQAFIKSLETNFKPVTGISGATILGDGTVSLILDAGAIVRLSSNSGT